MMMLKSLVIQGLLQIHGALILVDVEKFRRVSVVIRLNAVCYLGVYTWIDAGKSRAKNKRTDGKKEEKKDVKRI